MHDAHARTEERVDRFLLERLIPALHRSTTPLDVTAWDAPGEPVDFGTAAAAEYRPFTVGSPWGAPWGTTWFRVRGEVPIEWRQADGALPAGTRPELVVDLGFTAGQTGFQAEGLVWGRDGVPVKGIAPGNRAVAAAVDAQGRVDVFVEAAANPDVGSDWSFAPTVFGDPSTAGSDPLYVLRRVDVALLDETVQDLVADARALLGLLRELAVNPRRTRILAALERMVEAVDPEDVAGTAHRGRVALAEVLAQPANASAHLLHAVGHAHIDSAWLWPIRETVRKCARTFSNVLALMDEDPQVVFACSSAQQFAWVKESYPALYERIAKRVREGRFVPVGGMWVEADTNLPGGEAMARQFVAGKQFFLTEFGVECEEVWLPDSFGYSGALPQIAQLAGMRWFLTQKISWNDTNRMPHHTFLWEGIDGTRLFTHFPPVDKYNSEVSAADLAHAERTFADSAAASRSLLPYGYGDGGGGPTREMVAAIARTRSLEGSPRVEHSTPRRFFEEAEAEYPRPEVWSGELYLELHRGTYTSQRRTKQGNRRTEHLLREAELWAATAAIRAGAAYPADELERLWKLALLLQFHDILPGSSIAWVHRDAERNHAFLAERLEAMITASLDALVAPGDAVLEANATPHRRNGVPAMAVGAPLDRPAHVAVQHTPDGFVLDNGSVRATLAADGLIVSLIDLATGRETVPPGTRGNLFQLHQDIPTMWDAWDIDRHYRAAVTDLDAAESVTVADDGFAVRIERAFGASRLVQHVRLQAAGRELRIATEVDWHERQKLLKLAFPLDVHADRFASEIQFGHIERPTHTNTSWDAARFETSAHRWIRAGEPDFGVAITNDSTYGFDVSRIERRGGGAATLARLSILRAATFPDPLQDQGVHRFEVAVLAGATVEDAVAGGYRMNLAPRLVRGPADAVIAPLVTVSAPGVVVEAVKLAEDGSGDLVVRLYEALGRREDAEVVVDLPGAVIRQTDLLERPLADAAAILPTADGAVPGSSVRLGLRPFQIVTLRAART